MRLPKGHKEMHLRICHTRDHCHLGSEELRLGHDSGKPSVGNFSSCIGNCKTILIATSKIFERFCIEVPKIKYCHEHTKGDFSQPSRKDVCVIVKSLTSEAIPSATQFFKRAYKISHFSGL